MAEATIFFKDTSKGVEIGMNIADIDEQTEMTPALMTASMISFILERGYHDQFREEFFADYEKMIKEGSERSSEE